MTADLLIVLFFILCFLLCGIIGFMALFGKIRDDKRIAFLIGMMYPKGYRQHMANEVQRAKQEARLKAELKNAGVPVPDDADAVDWVRSYLNTDQTGEQIGPRPEKKS